MPEEKELLTVKEVAEYLRLSLPETYRLIQSKALTHFRVGPNKGAIRVALTDLKAFLNNRRLGQPLITAPKPRVTKLKHIKIDR